MGFTATLGYAQLQRKAVHTRPATRRPAGLRCVVNNTRQRLGSAILGLILGSAIIKRVPMKPFVLRRRV